FAAATFVDAHGVMEDRRSTHAVKCIPCAEQDCSAISRAGRRVRANGLSVELAAQRHGVPGATLPAARGQDVGLALTRNAGLARCARSAARAAVGGVLHEIDTGRAEAHGARAEPVVARALARPERALPQQAAGAPAGVAVAGIRLRVDAVPV